MASLFRLAARQGCRLLTSTVPRQTKLVQPFAYISTSKKNKDAASVTEPIQTPADQEVEQSLGEKEENWISYGYNLVDRDEDEWATHMTWFLGWTIAIVGVSFFLTYYPDLKERSWIQREAYLELYRREKEGLPLIDKNLVPEESVTLPDDSELGNTDIII